MCPRENRGYNYTYTLTRTFILLDIQSLAEEKQDFFLLFLLSLSFSFSFPSRFTFIQSSVMPLWCVSNSLLIQSLIIFIFFFNKIYSTDDYHHNHQVLKADVGQDITMSCIFDEGKLEQVIETSNKKRRRWSIVTLETHIFLSRG